MEYTNVTDLLLQRSGPVIDPRVLSAESTTQLWCRARLGALSLASNLIADLSLYIELDASDTVSGSVELYAGNELLAADTWAIVANTGTGIRIDDIDLSAVGGGNHIYARVVVDSAGSVATELRHFGKITVYHPMVLS